MKEQILEILKNNKKAISAMEINNQLNLNTVDELKDLLDLLKKMERELLVNKTKKDKYILFNDSHLKCGRLSMNKKGYGFVIMNNDPDIKIDNKNLNGAVHNDLVAVDVNNKGEAKIVKIIDRNLNQLVGEYTLRDGIGNIILDDKRYNINVEVYPEDSKGAMPGHKVLVKVSDILSKNNYRGKIVKILGHKEDPGIDILSIVYEYDINDVFAEEVLNEVETISTEVSSSELKNRIDLRSETIFTIDGDDAKDLDDAISIKKLANGNYKLGVHIADVSYYVKENSALDKEAYDRGTSVYLVDRVVPMLPHKLSNGICSLNEMVDRLTITCEMEINDQGDIVKHDIYQSVINSKKRMTYKNVNKILEKNETVVGYEDFIRDLKEMAGLASILRKNKEKRGYLDFDVDEMKIIVDEKGVPVDVKTRERGVAENLIEDFMIAANETVANHIFWMELPFVYRIHECPKMEKINSFLDFVSVLGYKIKGNRNNLSPKTVQGILNSLKDKKEFPILSSLLLMSMQKAKYSVDNVGHYGLASKCYTHFTSPIRRYPDTTVHRLLRTYLFENKVDNNTIEYWQKKLIPLCEHSSLKERNAIDCERAVDDLKAAEYMSYHIDEEFDGLISNITGFGMFIQLPNLIEGLVHISDMGDDYYEFNEKNISLIGKKNNKRYRIGDKVRIKVVSASKEDRTIDFQLVDRKKK